MYDDELCAPRSPRSSVSILAAAALWGTTGTAASFAPNANPLSIGSATMGVGGLILLALAGKSALAVVRSQRPLLFCGVVTVAIYPLAFYSSMALAGIAAGTVVTLGSAPVFAALLERVLDGRRLDRRWALATAFSLGGVFLLSAADTPSAAGNPIAGVLLGLLAGSSYAGYSWSAGRMMQHGHSPRAVMGAMFGAASALLVPVLVLSGQALFSTTSGIVVAAYLALVPMGLAYVLYGTGLRASSVGVATTLSLLEPVVATLLSVAVAGQRLAPASGLGIVLIGIGLLLVSMRRSH